MSVSICAITAISVPQHLFWLFSRYFIKYRPHTGFCFPSQPFPGAGGSLTDKAIPLLGAGQAMLYVPGIQKRLTTDDKDTAEELGQR